MRKIYILSLLSIATVGFLAFQHGGTESIEKFISAKHKFSSGGQPAYTGAPGDLNCTSCHNGQVQSGSTENILTVIDGANTVSSYVAGNSYTVSLQMASNPDKKGFSATALDGLNDMAGAFTGQTAGGTQDFISWNRHYVSHTVASNTNANTEWLWTWEAPVTDVGNVTFYVASNVANNDNMTTGDVIHLSTFIINSTTGILEESIGQSTFQVGYAAQENKVLINFTMLSVGEMFFNLVDLNGRSIYTYKMGKSIIGENNESIVLPDNIKNGIYVVHFFINNKAMSANIMVQR